MFKTRLAKGMLAWVLACSLPGLVFGQLPENVAQTREFEDAFLVTERAKLIDKVQKQGVQFDPHRETEKLQQKHMKVFGSPLPVPLLAEFDRTVRETPALTPEQLLRAADAGNKRGPTELSPELFMANARVKFLEDIREEGARFDTSKEFSKLSDRFEKNFGQPMPRDWQDAMFRSADDARTIVAIQRANAAVVIEAAKQKPKPKTPTPLVAPFRKASDGVQYPEGLPDWFRAADRDRDGQIGLYEWERARFAEFKKWDLNTDGFLEAYEVLRVVRPATPAANGKNNAKDKPQRPVSR